MSGATYSSPFAIGDRVNADGCQELVMIVTAVLWRAERPLVEVSWISGSSQVAWIEPWRLQAVA